MFRAKLFVWRVTWVSFLADIPPVLPDDTHPNPVMQVSPLRGKRRLSPLLVFFVALLVPVFCCGMTLLIYLVFPPRHIDILILGVDSRPGEGYVSRTDSIMLLGIDPAHLRTSTLSIPRDLFIEVPGFGQQRINTINVLGEEKEKRGGVDLLIASLAQDFDIQTDRYARLQFSGFVELIDAVGGVTVDVERSIVDDAYPTPEGGVTTIRFDSGVQHMDGERALIYARTRHADDDYQRADRQQQVLSALMAKMANPVHWPAVMAVLNRAVDTNLTVLDLALLAPPILLNAGRDDRLVIDRDYILGTAEGRAVPNYDKIKLWLAGRFE
jgi:LCP family protein required for cell wall assembly